MTAPAPPDPGPVTHSRLRRNHGLWAGLMVLNLSRSIVLGLHYPKAEAKAALA